MTFQEFNEFLKSAPEIIHWITASLLLGSYAQLALAYYASYNVLSKAIKVYFPIAHIIMSIYFFAKLQSEEYATMFDVFILLYVIYYINMVIVLKARYFRCFSSVKGFFKYKWHSKHHQKISKNV